MNYKEIDNMRREGSITWEQYGDMMRGKLKWNPLEAFRGRDRQGRLKSLREV